MNSQNWRADTFWLLLAGAFAIYLVAYATAYTCRSPAANLAYFVYAEQGTMDRMLYVLFWPPYRVHGLILRRARHLLDRPDQPRPMGP